MRNFLIGCCLLLLNPLQGQTILQTQKIWDAAPHNAFTDLVRYKGYFYCTFREADNHVPKGREQNGKVRVLRSHSSKNWESIALLHNGLYDLRDPKISVTPDHRLMVIMGGSDYSTGSLSGCVPHVSFSSDGRHFSDPQPAVTDALVRSDFDWIWRITWKGGTGYGVVYQPNQPDAEIAVHLLSTTDGIHYQLVCKLGLTGKPNEATIRFEGDRMYIVIRREGSGTNGMLGVSDPPYQSWKWTDLGMRIGGPEFIFTGPGKIAMGTRLYHTAEEGGAKTGVVFMNSNGVIGNILELPSGGDTSYPGMVICHGKIYMSYYSNHEGKPSIYLAVIK